MTASNEGKPTLGFVGLGAMGFGMAANLVQSGVQVTGFDLNPAARERFAALSPDARAAGNVAETCEGQSRLWVMVATPAQADSVIFESDALQTLPRGAMICLFSTLPPAYVTGLPARLGAAGRSDVRLVDCPVSGGVVGAAGGKLTIMIGAELETYEEIQPELRAVSAPGRVFHCGALGAASTVKMLNQLLAGVHVVAAAEMMAFARAQGTSTRATYDVVRASPAASWIFGDRGLSMLRADWSPRSAVTIFMKDLGIVNAAADGASLPVPLASAALQAFVERAARGGGGDDDASVVCNYEDVIGQHVSEAEADATTQETDGCANGQGDGTGGTASHGAHDVAMRRTIQLGRLVHLAAAAECHALALAQGVDAQLVYDLIAGAAGSSAQFNRFFPDMLAGSYSSVRDDESTGRESLAAATDSLRDLKDTMTRVRFPGRLLDAAHQIFKAADSRVVDGENTSVAAVALFWGSQGEKPAVI